MFQDAAWMGLGVLRKRRIYRTTCQTQEANPSPGSAEGEGGAGAESLHESGRGRERGVALRSARRSGRRRHRQGAQPQGCLGEIRRMKLVLTCTDGKADPVLNILMFRL